MLLSIFSNNNPYSYYCKAYIVFHFIYPCNKLMQKSLKIDSRAAHAARNRRDAP